MVKINVKSALFSCFLMLTLSSCATTDAPAPPVEKAPQAPAVYSAPPVSKPSKPNFTPINDDLCGAKPLQYLVGRLKTEIPVPLDPNSRRVLCTSCAATMDYNPSRQNIIFDAETGVIKSVSCG